MDRDRELELVARLRRGDTEAFDEVYEHYRARVFSFLWRLARRRDVAEDLMEDVWVRLVQHAPSLREDTRLAPWLFTVARNRYWSYCRARRVEQFYEGRAAGLWPPPASPACPLEEAVASELDARVEHAIGALPASLREVLLLVSVDGVAHADAAAACGLTEVALRKRLSRARAMLGDALARSGREPHRAPVPSNHGER